MKLTLNVWRQENLAAEGRFERYEVADIDPDASFLEMLDVLNDRLVSRGRAARSRSTTTAARASAAPARWSSTARPTARAR